MKCRLCGFEIKKKKGMNQKIHAIQLQEKAHIECLMNHKGILQKHHISPNEHLNAIIGGLFELLPDLRVTKDMKDYDDRVKEATKEIEEKFPYLKNQVEKAKEKVAEE